ncbi:hypothetical protein PHLGIDRAFT_113300 [Phlebiopsis gigantea 11061_1 CR5-6]|uniref:F-box domain-containing protein n=1 Tax=Phlebiopsis gigantea (strain 11061_1 CR5-6) TaxID=745531 RepID=A0A0C3SEF6_PHLG1|nr:hypothetical protein PHLGIDRAFT_113300 [Phlebiopsis gigantea 11061_1 CR5-6]
MAVGCVSRGWEFSEDQVESVMGNLDALIDIDSEISPNTSALHEELLRLENLGQKLSQRLRDISGSRYKVLFSLTKMKATLHSLPPELLVQVFIHATFADKSSYRWYMDNNVEWGPVELSHVCRRWRLLALGTSCLWTTIFARNAFAFATYIDRAGHQDVDLVWMDVNVECEPESALGRLSKLSRHGVRNRVRSIAWADSALRRLIIHRTKKQKQEATSNDIPVHELAALLGRLPLLEDLALNGYSSIADDAPTRVLVILPHLRAFTWNRASAKKLWRLFTLIDFSGLQSLRLSTRTASKALQNTLQMEHSIVARLPKLRQFCLICDTTEDFKLACRRLELPSLESLVLARSLHGTFPILPNPAQIFREPRLAHVTQLSLHNLDLRLEDTVALLSYFPALKKLVLDSCQGNYSNHSIVVIHQR